MRSKPTMLLKCRHAVGMGRCPNQVLAAILILSQIMPTLYTIVMHFKNPIPTKGWQIIPNHCYWTPPTQLFHLPASLFWVQGGATLRQIYLFKISQLSLFCYFNFLICCCVVCNSTASYWKDWFLVNNPWLTTLVMAGTTRVLWGMKSSEKKYGMI